MMKKAVFLLCLGLLFTPYVQAKTEPTPQPSPSEDAEPKEYSFVDWQEGRLRVTGVGVPPDTGNIAHRNLMAERSAMADAYSKMAKVVYEIPYNAQTLVQDYIFDEPMVAKHITHMIEQSKKTDQRYLSDGRVEVDFELDLHGAKGLSTLLAPYTQSFKAPDLETEPRKFPPEYTGVIIDCRSLRLQPALSPLLLEQSGGAVYPHAEHQKEREAAIRYYRSLMAARSDLKRVGQTPLILRPIQVHGTFKTDPVLEASDTALLLGLEKNYRLLSRHRVAFVY